MAAIANTIFKPETAARFDRLETIYPLKRSALVPMLLYAQDEIGYVSARRRSRRLRSGWTCSTWMCGMC